MGLEAKGGLEWAIGIVNGSTGDGEAWFAGAGDMGTILSNMTDTDTFSRNNAGLALVKEITIRIGMQWFHINCGAWAYWEKSQ